MRDVGRGVWGVWLGVWGVWLGVRGLGFTGLVWNSSTEFPDVSAWFTGVTCKKTQPSRTLKRTPPGPYRRPIPRVKRESEGGKRFLMSEVPL